MKDYQGDTTNSKLCRVIRQFHKIAKSDCQFRHVRLSVNPSDRKKKTTRLPIEGFARNFLFGHFSRKSRQNSSFITI